MANRTYHWIHNDGIHQLDRRRKARHYRKRNFKYFVIASYGAQADQGLCVHSPRGLTPRHVLRYKLKLSIRRTFLCEPLQVLDVQENHMEFLSFKPRDTPKLKGYSASTKDMLHKRYK